MRRFWIILVLVLGAFSLSLAQNEDTRTAVTPGGMEVTYPASFIATNEGDFELVMTAVGTDVVINMSVTGADAVQSRYPGSYTDATGFIEEFRTFGMGTFDGIEAITQNFPNGTAVYLTYQSLLGGAMVIAIDLPEGGLAVVEVYAIGSETPEPITDALDTWLAIAGSVRLGVEPTDSVVEGDLSVLDVPEGALTPDQMPAGQIVFGTFDVVMPIPEGWRFIDEAAVADSVALQFGSMMQATMTVSLMDTTTFASFGDWRSAMMTAFGGLVSPDGSAEPDVLERPDGLTFEKFAAADQRFVLFFLDLGDTGLLTQLMLFMEPVDTAAIDAVEEALRAAVRFSRGNGTEASDTAGTGASDSAFEADCFTDSRVVSLEVGQTATFTCPSGCLNSGGSIWGSDIYTDDSSVCRAAIHGGVITDAEGGAVEITRLGGQDSYTGSTRNDVTTNDYGSWGGSFSVAAPAR